MTITTSTGTIRAATAADGPAISTVLAGAFADDPVFCWMIPDDVRRRRLLPGVFALFAEAFTPLGVSQVLDGVAGAALWAAPGQQPVPDADAERFMGRIAQLTGPDVDRIGETMELLEAQHPHEPCYYLNFLGVDPQRRGRGLGSALLSVAGQRCDAEGQPAYLEATSPLNRRLYARHGFDVVGEIVLPGGPPLWPMWREPRP